MSELAIYRDEQHAIVRAMSLDAITTCKPAQWLGTGRVDVELEDI